MPLFLCVNFRACLRIYIIITAVETLKPSTFAIQAVRYKYKCFPHASCDKTDLNGLDYYDIVQ